MERRIQIINYPDVHLNVYEQDNTISLSISEGGFSFFRSFSKDEIEKFANCMLRAVNHLNEADEKIIGGE